MPLSEEQSKEILVALQKKNTTSWSLPFVWESQLDSRSWCGCFSYTERTSQYSFRRRTYSLCTNFMHKLWQYSLVEFDCFRVTPLNRKTRPSAKRGNGSKTWNRVGLTHRQQNNQLRYLLSALYCGKSIWSVL